MKVVAVPHGSYSLFSLSSVEVKEIEKIVDLVEFFGPIYLLDYHNIFVTPQFVIQGFYNKLCPSGVKFKNSIAEKMEFKAFGTIYLVKYDLNTDTHTDFSIEEFQYLFNKFDHRFMLDERLVEKFDQQWGCQEDSVADEDVDWEELQRPKKRKRTNED